VCLLWGGNWICGTLARRRLGFNALIIDKLGILQCTLYLHFTAHYNNPYAT